MYIFTYKYKYIFIYIFTYFHFYTCAYTHTPTHTPATQMASILDPKNLPIYGLGWAALSISPGLPCAKHVGH